MNLPPDIEAMREAYTAGHRRDAAQQPDAGTAREVIAAAVAAQLAAGTGKGAS